MSLHLLNFKYIPLMCPVFLHTVKCLLRILFRSYKSSNNLWMSCFPLDLSVFCFNLYQLLLKLQPLPPSLSLAKFHFLGFLIKEKEALCMKISYFHLSADRNPNNNIFPLNSPRIQNSTEKSNNLNFQSLICILHFLSGNFQNLYS